MTSTLTFDTTDPEERRKLIAAVRDDAGRWQAVAQKLDQALRSAHKHGAFADLKLTAAQQQVAVVTREYLRALIAAEGLDLHSEE